MKYQIQGGGWPVGDRVVEAGTIIDTDKLVPHDPFHQRLKSAVPPPNSMPLDQDAYEAMMATYGVVHAVGNEVWVIGDPRRSRAL